MLLSRVLLAFAVEFEHESPVLHRRGLPGGS